MSFAPPAAPAYVCRFCRQVSDATAASCPRCGAPVDIRARVSTSGWEEQPAIRDMARIQFGQSSCQIEGTYVPTADFRLAGDDSVFFSHHTLLWTEPGVVLDRMPMAGGWNRVRAGLPLVMMTGSGPGHLALSEDAPGEIVAIPLQPGQEVWVREHRFLVATRNVSYTWSPSGVWFVTGSGDDRSTHYPLGQFLDQFRADAGPGLLVLHAAGNTFVRDLQPGEAICVQPSALLYKDPSVGIQLHLEYPRSGFGFSRNYSYRHVWLRMWGPGRVAIQSIFERPEGSEPITGHSPATTMAW